MNRKIQLTTSFILVFILVVFSIPISLAQNEWDWCVISAYGTNLIEGETTPQSFKFTVEAPPTGSEILNIISLERGTEENYTYNLSPGDEVDVNYIDAQYDTYSFDDSSEAGHYVILYAGEARTLTVNREAIPEYSLILVVPLFLVLTLLAIIYRREHKQ